MKRAILILAGLIGLAVIGVVGWYLASPLFIDNVVDEEFIVAAPNPEAAMPEAGSVPNEAGPAQMSGAEIRAKEAELVESAAAMPDKIMDDPMPVDAAVEPTAVVQGMFQDADSFHRGAGEATLYQLADGSHVLRLENFEVTNGPDLHVLLVEHPNPTSREEIMSSYLDLGSLKGNIGNQNYSIPAGTNISAFKSVVIYCQPFHVIFSTASLN